MPETTTDRAEGAPNRGLSSQLRLIRSWARRLLQLSDGPAEPSLERDRSYLSVYCMIALAVVGPSSGLLYGWLGMPLLGLGSAAVGFVALGCLVFMARGTSWRPIASVMLAALLLLFSVVVLGTGGSRSPIFACALLHPVLAATLGGRPYLWRWSLATLLALVAIVWVGPLELGSSSVMATAVEHPLLRPLAVGVCVLLASFAAYTQEGLHLRAHKVVQAAHRQAEHAGEVKSHFLMGLSHELLTPMNGIVGLSELLDGTELDLQQRELVDGVRDTAGGLNTILHDLLAYVEALDERAELDNSEVELLSALTPVIEQYARAARVKGLHWKFVDEVGSRTLCTDAARLVRCVRILMDNAVKFTREGRIEVCFDESADSLVVTVTDTGIGIPAQAREQIFDLFHQRETGYRRNYGGLGLGLTLLQAESRLLGAELTCESTPGRGSRFRWRLPMRPSRAEAA